MSTDLPSQNESPANAMSTEQETPVATPSQSQLSASQPLIPPRPIEEEEAFYFEGEQLDLAESFVEPFQFSGDMPMTTASATSSSQPSLNVPTPPVPPIQRKQKMRFSLTTIAIVICVIIVVGLFAGNALGQTTPALHMHREQTQTMPQKSVKKNEQAAKPTPSPKTTQTNGAQGQATIEWVPQQLPDGWTDAGFLQEDAIQAIRTAVAFNDREMSLDYRSVGTRNNHAGTFTAATFVMTVAARQRFVQNDVRESSNALFDMIVSTRQVRLVVDPQPKLVSFARMGQQEFAWVNVAFQLWRSQTDPNHPQQRIEGKELDPATHQPLIHHMMVLLLHVPAQDAGANPAMGGTGWLVSNYGLDLPNGSALDIVQPA